MKEDIYLISGKNKADLSTSNLCNSILKINAYSVYKIITQLI